MEYVEIRFLKWVSENHFYLHNIEKGIYYWKGENQTLTTIELFKQWRTAEKITEQLKV
jgi:hypothetical protein